MKIKAYLKEIQYRLFFTLCTFITSTFVLFQFKEQLLFLLGQHQLTKYPHFIATNLPEMLFSLIKLSCFLALYTSFPIVIVQGCFFFIPALYKYEYKIVKNFIILSILLFLLSNYFTYKALLPYCWEFFTKFELSYVNDGINVQLETRLHEYLNFIIEIFLSITIILNSCLFLSFILIKFPINTLIKLRKLIYFCSFITATLLTPPDIISQIIVGIIIIIIYEFFLFFLFLNLKYKKGE